MAQYYIIWHNSPPWAGRISVEVFKPHQIISEHPAGLLLTSDSSPLRLLSTQHTINARDEYPFPQWDSNPRSQ
jgi:hypothetical protein